MVPWPGAPQAEAARVRLAIYAILVLLAAIIDHACLSVWWFAPDLSLALAAWAMVDGTEAGVVGRAGIAGLARDLADPVGFGFHTIILTILGVAFLPLRRFLFRTRAAAWIVWAASCYLVVHLADGVLTGFGDLTLKRLLVGALGTALTAVACGWLFGGLPKAIRPVGIGGA